MNRPRPLDAFPLVRTSSIEELEHSLGHIIAAPVLDLVDRGRKLVAVQNYFPLQHIGINYGSYGTDIRFRFPEPTIIAQIFPLSGKAEVQVGGESVAIDADHSAIVSADSGFKMTSSADYERLNLNISPAALTKILSAMTGESIGAALKIDPIPASTPSARSLRDHFIFLTQQISAAQSLPHLLLTEFEQTLLIMFLHTNKHNYSHLLEREPPDVASRQVRRTEDYIEANWNTPMSFEAIAAEVGVSIRSLFATFRRSRGYSPAEFLRQTRLRHARRMLQDPEPCTTTENVAFACGFADLGRFMRDYLRAFGQRPSETLAGSKGGDITWH